MNTKDSTDSFPQFFVVGAAKSGTTAIWRYLSQHPQIFVTKNIANKELGYFSKGYGIAKKEQYLKHFQEADSHQIAGEVCHAYLTSPESAEWIKNEVPDSKIIIILRNPVDRAFSLYNWMVMHGYETAASFGQALDNEEKRRNRATPGITFPHQYLPNYLYFSSGLYFEQVKRYKEVFGESLLILMYDDFKENPSEVMHVVFDFLEVERYNLVQKDRVNASLHCKSAKVQHYAKKLERIKKIRPKLLRSSVRAVGRIISNWNLTNDSSLTIAPQMRKNLTEKYREDVKLLSELIDINLTAKWFL